MCFGAAAQELIDKENTTWHKNDPAARRERFARIRAHWGEITQIMEEELPSAADTVALMQSLACQSPRGISALPIRKPAMRSCTPAISATSI